MNTAEGAGSADLVLMADGRELRFPAMWLRDNCPCAQCQDPGGRTEDDKELWLPRDLAGRPPEASWPRYLSQPADRIRALDAVLRLGFVLLRDVPADPGMARRSMC